MNSYCFVCEARRTVTAVLGSRKAHLIDDLFYVNVRLSCGHERHEDERLVMTTTNRYRLETSVGVTAGAA